MIYRLESVNRSIAQCAVCKVRRHCIFFGPGIRYSGIFGVPGMRYSVIIKLPCALLLTGHLDYKQMLEKAFCSNIAPSLSSGNHLFYKAEYMGQSCPIQVWAITFDWSALAT